MADTFPFNIACKEQQIAQMAEVNHLFQLLHLFHIYGHGVYELSCMLNNEEKCKQDVIKVSPAPSMPSLNYHGGLVTRGTESVFIMADVRTCESPGCNQPAKLQCPNCIKLGIQGSFFCAQVDCFIDRFRHLLAHCVVAWVEFRFGPSS